MKTSHILIVTSWQMWIQKFEVLFSQFCNYVKVFINKFTYPTLNLMSVIGVTRTLKACDHSKVPK